MEIMTTSSKTIVPLIFSLKINLIEYHPDAGLRVFNGFFAMLLFDSPLYSYVWTFIFETFRSIWLFFIDPPSDFHIDTRSGLFFLYPIWISIGIGSAIAVRSSLSMKYSLVYHRKILQEKFQLMWESAIHPTIEKNTIFLKYYFFLWAIFLSQYATCTIIDHHNPDDGLTQHCVNGMLFDREHTDEIGSYITNSIIFLLVIICACVSVDRERLRFKYRKPKSPPPQSLSTSFLSSDNIRSHTSARASDQPVSSHRYAILYTYILTWHIYLFLVTFFSVKNQYFFYGTSAFFLGLVVWIGNSMWMSTTPLHIEFEREENASLKNPSDPTIDAIAILQKIALVEKASIVADQKSEEIRRE